MRKVKGSISFIAIGSLIFAVVVSVLFYVLIFHPLAQGPLKGLESGSYCTVTKTATGHCQQTLSLDFDRIYNPIGMELYITPGGQMGIHSPRIEVSLKNGTGELDVGSLRNIKKSDVGNSLPCFGTERSSLVGDRKDYCDSIPEYMSTGKARVKGVKATSKLVEGCIGLILAGCPTVCSVDKMKVKIMYPCRDKMTLVRGNCSGGSIGEGWNYMTPLDCQLGSGSTTSNFTPCTMEDGKWAVKDFNFSREMKFPGTPMVRIGTRAGCAGIQTGCNISFFASRAPDNSDCSSATSWNEIANFSNLDYEYIYSEPVNVGSYVNNNQSSLNHKLWCLKAKSNEGCYLNGIHVSKYLGT